MQLRFLHREPLLGRVLCNPSRAEGRPDQTGPSLAEWREGRHGVDGSDVHVRRQRRGEGEQVQGRGEGRAETGEETPQYIQIPSNQKGLS